MLKYLFLLLMLCSPALASLSGSEDVVDVDVDVDPWDKLSANKPESALRRGSTSARNLCDSAESSEPNKFIPDHKNLTIYHDRIIYVYSDRI